ncbi:site-specific DNA-methyltransferase [uncultured Fibrella sp.]|uniref:site-specific DNA-methyltransferase n=1 Tax=uncultured Fibrella sp. TaxID=1284596 RepID=UPI0035CBB477
MPTLTWIGKDKVINHHHDVPFRVLDAQYTYGEADSPNRVTGNRIIHGDNLEALKALLPYYEGRIKCIYIDPPYNTGKENWVYNDNVNDPKIKRWLDKIVGKETEDFSRHDKWLCMMCPRLKLLHAMLAEDGLIFISIDDNEYHNLKILMDEVFGRRNMLVNFTWRTDGNFDNQAKIKKCHEYILVYAKNEVLFNAPQVIDPNVNSESKLFKTEIRNTIVKNGSKNPVSRITLPIGFPASFKNGIIRKRENSFPIYHQDAFIEDFKLLNQVEVESGWSSKDILLKYINTGFQAVKDTKGQNTFFEIIPSGAIENYKPREGSSHVISVLQNLGSTQNTSEELKKMGIKFDYPKPVDLIKYLISLVADPNCIVLDSFAGSGTTADAVLKLNQDGGNRTFILIQMTEKDKEGKEVNICETITAERVRRVIDGYGDKEGTGGGFTYYELGEALFTDDGLLNEALPLDRIREYVWYSETRTALPSPTADQPNADEPAETPHFLGRRYETAYYFYYKRDELTTLDYDFLATVQTRAEQYVIYADNCLINREWLQQRHIIFKKIPRDISRF